MPEEGAFITDSDGNIQVYLNGEWVTLGNAQLTPPLDWAPAGPGHILMSPGPNTTYPLPDDVPDGSICLRSGSLPLVRMHGGWWELQTAQTAAHLQRLEERLAKLEKIVDVSSRFRQIAEDDTDIESTIAASRSRLDKKGDPDPT